MYIEGSTFESFLALILAVTAYAASRYTLLVRRALTLKKYKNVEGQFTDKPRT